MSDLKNRDYFRSGYSMDAIAILVEQFFHNVE